MFKILRLILILLFIYVSPLYAINEEPLPSSIENEDPDEAGTAMPNIGISEPSPIIEVIEGAGTVLSAGVAYRKEPNLNAPIIRKSTKGEKVLLIGETEDNWLLVRMYNNQEAYIMKPYVRLEKVFRDESTTVNSMDKKAYIDIGDLINKFNKIVKNSPYATKYQVVPSLILQDARKVKKKMSLVFLYSSTDIKGKMLPSYRDNHLQKQMLSLIELIIIKMLLTQTDSYSIIIHYPIFTDSGSVKDTNSIYATIDINYDDINMSELKGNISSIWNFAKLTLKPEELFSRFP